MDAQLGAEKLHDCLAWARGAELCGGCFVCNLVAVMREVRRVLRDDGVAFLVLGDTFAGGAGGRGDRDREIPRADGTAGKPSQKHDGKRIPKPPIPGLKPKDLCGIPWRVALALQADGWFLRSDIIWAKPNPMPESVTDRPTQAHEHVFLLAKQGRYYYDAEAVAEESSGQTGGNFSSKYAEQQPAHGAMRLDRPVTSRRNLRNVLTIPTRSFRGQHFAVFPPALVEPCIKAGTSEKGCCAACGAPWERVVERGEPNKQTTRGQQAWTAVTGQRDSAGGLPEVRTLTVGWRPGCECDAGEPIPCTILDPFFGAGTVGLVAERLGRRWVGIELNAEYAALAEKRIAARGDLRPHLDAQAQQAAGQLPLGGMDGDAT